MKRKASFSVETVTNNTLGHNSRKNPPKYLIETDENFNGNFNKSYHDMNDFFEAAAQQYKEKVKQKMQKAAIENFYKEAVISLEDHHTEKDIEKLFEKLKEEYGGHELINISIHRDEGHFEYNGIEFYPTKHILKRDDGWYIKPDWSEAKSNDEFTQKVDISKFRKVYNHHAHAVFTMFDTDKGKNARMTKGQMSKRLKLVADSLDMGYKPDKATRLVKKNISHHKDDKAKSRDEKLNLYKKLKKTLSDKHKTILEQKTTIDTLKDDLSRLEQDMSVLRAKSNANFGLNQELKEKVKKYEKQIQDLSLQLTELQLTEQTPSEQATTRQTEEQVMKQNIVRDLLKERGYDHTKHDDMEVLKSLRTDLERERAGSPVTTARHKAR
jgi:hypothetical protein